MDQAPRWNDPAIAVFQSTGGNHPQFGRDLVLMHGRGASSGRPRPHLARGIAFREGWLVAASFGGRPTDPAWVTNLRVHPDIDLEVPQPAGGTRSFSVRALELAGADREEARALFLRISPVFGRLEAGAGRPIPIFYLERR